MTYLCTYMGSLFKHFIYFLWCFILEKGTKGRQKWQRDTRPRRGRRRQRQWVQKSLGKKNSYCMLFNIWKTCWLSAQILPRGCWAWEKNRVAVRLTVRSLSEANTLFIRLSVCLFIWLSNYPAQQTAHHEPNVNNTVDDGHVSQLVGLLPWSVELSHWQRSKEMRSAEAVNWFCEQMWGYFCDVVGDLSFELHRRGIKYLYIVHTV